MKRIVSFLLCLLPCGLLATSGCSAQRQALAPRGSDPALLAESPDERPPKGAAGAELHETADAIQPVAFQEDGESTAPPEAELPVPSDGAVEPDELPWPGEGMTLPALESLALENNPAIRQVSAAAAKAAGIREQVGLKPNPTIGYFGEEIGNESSAGLQGAFVSQQFVRGDKLAWNRQVIGHDVNALLWQVETQRRRVLTDIRVQFYEALAAQQRLALAEEFREIAARAVQVSEERLEARFGTRPDVLQSEIQLSEVDLSIQQARFEFEAAWRELAAVAGTPGLAPTTLVGELSVPEKVRVADVVQARIEGGSPLLASALARVDRARANLQRQQVEPIPNVTAQLGVGHDDATGDEFANVQLSLPLPVHNRNQGNIRAAYAEYCEATQNVQRIRMQIRRDVARAMREYQTAAATVAQYETSILPKARETLALMQEAQEAGEFDFLRVLTARRTYFDVSLRYVTALADLAQANAQIDGLLLAGGLSNVAEYNVGDDLRGQTLSGQ